MEEQTFAQDYAELMQEQRARGMSRRDLLRSALAMGVAPLAVGAMGARNAFAADKPEVVLVNWGGVSVDVFKTAFADPYVAAGGKMVIDGSGPVNGKILTMVQSKNVTWDICDGGITTIAELGPKGALEPIDYSIVDKSKVMDGFAYELGVVNYFFSTVMAWDTAKIQGTPTLADFFDIKKIPGRRMIRKDSQAMLEMALLADGVAIKDLYPMDVERAMAKFESIKDSLLFWSSGAESQSLLRDGECVMGFLWSTRANVLKSETKGRVAYTFKDGLLQPGIWVVPKGNPAGKEAFRAIASMQRPKEQLYVLEQMGNGPANPAAAGLVPESLRADNPSDPANAAVQAKMGADWYIKNHSKVFQAFMGRIAS
ncbi:MAG TPA: extracellular solute-binding protein [Bordetella sp.]